MYRRKELIEAVILEYQRIRSREHIRSSFAKKYPPTETSGEGSVFDPRTNSYSLGDYEYPEDRAREGLRPGLPSRVGSNIAASKHSRLSRRVPRSARKAAHYKKRRGSIDRGYEFSGSASYDHGPDPLF